MCRPFYSQLGLNSDRVSKFDDDITRPRAVGELLSPRLASFPYLVAVALRAVGAPAHSPI